MKIAILTQPLQTNYGGLLQAFALQSVLKKMGHEVLIVNRTAKKPHFVRKTFSVLKRCIKQIFYYDPTYLKPSPSNKEKEIITQHTNRFIKENIQTTEKIDSLEKLSLLKKYKI